MHHFSHLWEVLVASYWLMFLNFILYIWEGAAGGVLASWNWCTHQTTDLHYKQGSYMCIVCMYIHVILTLYAMCILHVYTVHIVSIGNANNYKYFYPTEDFKRFCWGIPNILHGVYLTYRIAGIIVRLLIWRYDSDLLSYNCIIIDRVTNHFVKL